MFFFFLKPYLLLYLLIVAIAVVEWWQLLVLNCGVNIEEILKSNSSMLLFCLAIISNRACDWDVHNLAKLAI